MLYIVLNSKFSMLTSLPCALVDIILALELEVNKDVSNEAGGDEHCPEYSRVASNSLISGVQ